MSDEGGRQAVDQLREALRHGDVRAIDRAARHLRSLLDQTRPQWADANARDADTLLDEADRRLGWCVGFQVECPEVRQLLDTIEAEGCGVSVTGGVVSIRSQHGASSIAQRAGRALDHHARDHGIEVCWMVTGQLP